MRFENWKVVFAEHAFKARCGCGPRAPFTQHISPFFYATAMASKFLRRSKISAPGIRGDDSALTKPSKSSHEFLAKD